MINAFRDSNEYSIFLTGSNSYLLSGELATKLTGRYVEFEISTLSFDEYLDMKGFYGRSLSSDLDEELINYINEGGFPRAIFYHELEGKREYVSSVISEIYEKDVKNNKKIRDKELFGKIQRFVINNLGSTLSVSSLCEALGKGGKPARRSTVYKYLEILENLKIVSKCERFDLKSKKSLNGEAKYYLSDLSFYFASNVDNRINYGPVLENIFYGYARSSGYKLSVGKIGRLKVDFIIRKADLDYVYVQIARTIDNGNYDEKGVNLTEEREYRSLEAIKDNYPKYVLTMDKLLQRRNGIIHKNLVAFMAGKEQL